MKICPDCETICFNDNITKCSICGYDWELEKYV